MVNNEDKIINKINNSDSEYKIKTSYKDLKPGINIETSSDSFVKGKKSSILRYSIFAIIPIIVIIGIVLITNFIKPVGIDSQGNEGNQGNEGQEGEVISDPNADKKEKDSEGSTEEKYTYTKVEGLSLDLGQKEIVNFAMENGFILDSVGASTTDKRGESETKRIYVSITDNENEVRIEIVKVATSTEKATSEFHVITNEFYYNYLKEKPGSYNIVYYNGEYKLCAYDYTNSSGTIIEPINK